MEDQIRHASMIFKGADNSFSFPDGVFPRSNIADQLVLAPQAAADRMRRVATQHRKLDWARDVLLFQGRYGMLERQLIAEAYQVVENASQDPNEDGALGSYLLAILQNDPSRRREYLRLAIKKGSPRAWYSVGTSSEMSGDHSRAKTRYERGVRRGDTACLYRLALASRPVDLESLAKAATGADSDFPLPAYTYGLILLGEVEIANVSLPQRDPGTAFAFIERAAALGHAEAQLRMSAAYQGGFRGFDCIVSLRYLHLAARQEAWLSYQKSPTNLQGKPASQLVKWFLCGYPGALEPKESLAYGFAEWGATEGEPTSLFAMGYFCEVGVGCSQDSSASIKYYQESASKGCDAAKTRLNQLTSPLRRTLTRKDYDTVLTNQRSQKAGQKTDPRMLAVEPGALPYPNEATSTLNSSEKPRNASTPYPSSPKRTNNEDALPYPKSPVGTTQHSPSSESSISISNDRPVSMPPVVPQKTRPLGAPRDFSSTERHSAAPVLSSNNSGSSEPVSLPYPDSNHLDTFYTPSSSPSHIMPGTFPRRPNSFEASNVVPGNKAPTEPVVLLPAAQKHTPVPLSNVNTTQQSRQASFVGPVEMKGIQSAQNTQPSNYHDYLDSSTVSNSSSGVLRTQPSGFNGDRPPHDVSALDAGRGRILSTSRPVLNSFSGSSVPAESETQESRPSTPIAPLDQVSLESPKEPIKTTPSSSRPRNLSPSKIAGRLKRFVSGGMSPGAEDLPPPPSWRQDYLGSNTSLSTPEACSDSSSPESSPNSSPRLPRSNRLPNGSRSPTIRTDSLSSEAASSYSTKKPGVAYSFDDMGIKTAAKDKGDTCVIS